MPPLPSRPDIMYSSPDLPDFEALMGFVEGGQAKVVVSAQSPLMSDRIHLFAGHDVPDSEIVGTAIGDRILPIVSAIGTTSCLSYAEYNQHFGRADNLPRVIDAY